MASRWAEAAKAIRKDLKAAFPNETFRVRSDAGSMYSAVHVSYNPERVSYEEIRHVVNKYEYGSFNGMTDLYECTNRRDDVPQVSFVIVQEAF